jgi:phage terminase large subunit-like protein
MLGTAPTSPAEVVMHYGAGVPPTVAADLLATMSDLELAVLLHDFAGFWARPKQAIDAGAWQTFGFCTGRGFGKTLAVSSWVQREVFEGRVRHIGVIGQNEDETRKVMVDGKCGLLATSPPWFKARFTKGEVVWPNGARARVLTPEKPGKIRGYEFDLAWLSELIAWPAATRDEAFSNLEYATRAGLARMVWDTTPKRRHPMLKRLFARAEAAPHRHVVVRGSTLENAANLPPGKVQQWLDEYGHTRAGREELHGEFFDESDGALWSQEWIDRTRRRMPTKLKRRIISIDPAISDRRGTDNTGISDLGLGLDDQVLVIADFSGPHSWEDWGAWTVEYYMRQRCDCVVVETDRGGDGIAANIRACARERGFEVQVVKVEAPTRHNHQTIYVKEVRSRQRSKEGRARPVATLAEQGRISHVTDDCAMLKWGAPLKAPPDRESPSDLSALEDTLTTWEPDGGGRSPDDLDAMVHGVWELTNLWNKDVDHRAGFKGLGRAAEQLDKQTARGARREAAGTSLHDVIGRTDWGDTL